LKHKKTDLIVRIYIGGRTGMLKPKSSRTLKQNGSVEPWIIDPTATVAVDRAVSPAHGSTMVQAKGHSPV
jgi:hypothetical protein